MRRLRGRRGWRALEPGQRTDRNDYPEQGDTAIYFAGIDIGSTMTKAVIVDETSIVCAVTHYTGPSHRHQAAQVMIEALDRSGISFESISFLVATGYGRMNVPFADRQVTELTCHARGVTSLFPRARLVIDIGGQDAKALSVLDGKLIDFVMNDKCAAGTGRFLEVVAGTLGLEVEQLAEVSSRAIRKAPISSTCTVFAEEEIVSNLSNGVPLEEVIAGLHDSVAERVARMARRLKIEPDVVFTGGVAKNSAVAAALEEHLQCPLRIPQDPLITGALGAALIAREIALRSTAGGQPIVRGRKTLGETTFFG